LAGEAVAGSARLRAVVLDACTLFTAAPRDTLLRAAGELYRPYWSELILGELGRNLIEDRCLTAEQAERLLGVLRRAFPDAMVSGFEALIEQMPNQEKDRHVVAAAVHARADAVITYNVRDFPKPLLAPLGIDVQTPDESLCELVKRAPEKLVDVVMQQAAALRAPPMTPKELLQRIDLHTPTFAALMRETFG
jgi:hypothetical protein